MTHPWPDEDLDRLTALVVTTLTKCGQARVCQDGRVQAVTIGRRGLTPSGMFLLKVDTERLPHGVFVENLVSERIRHQLAAVTHHPVDVLNTTGVTYVIHLGETCRRPALPDRVRLADVLPQHPGGLALPVGQGPDGPVWKKLDSHLLVGGETGAGKTTWLKATLVALATVNQPEMFQLVMIDPKAVDFLPLTGLPHLARPIVVEPREAEETIDWLAGQVDERRRLFLRAPAGDIAQYNARVPEKLPYIVAVVDEVTTLVDLTGGKKGRLHQQLQRLAGIARAFGVYLVLATQNPKADILDTHLRGNLGLRIAFRVSTAEHSRVILGTAGAEKLPNVKGRLLARPGGERLLELQGYTVTDEELASLGRPAEPLALLDRETRAIRQHALEHLDGRFPQDELMAAGWTRPQYRQAVVKLRQAGLLEGGPGVALTVH